MTRAKPNKINPAVKSKIIQLYTNDKSGSNLQQRRILVHVQGRRDKMWGRIVFVLQDMNLQPHFLTSTTDNTLHTTHYTQHTTDPSDLRIRCAASPTQSD